jgi:vacuolar-type H+-ATPase subunit E/Vma4
VGLSALVAHIQAEGEASAAAILARAEGQAAQIQAEAQVEAERDRAEIEQAAAQSQPEEAARLLNQARFAALCQTGLARDELVEQVLDDVRQQLSRVRQGPDYPALLAHLLDETFPASHNHVVTKPEEGFMLEADPLDQTVLAHILDERGMTLAVDYCLVCWGGLNARSIDGKVTLLNTLESRLARAAPYLCQRLAGWVETGFAEVTVPERSLNK